MNEFTGDQQQVLSGALIGLSYLDSMSYKTFPMVVDKLNGDYVRVFGTKPLCTPKATAAAIIIEAINRRGFFAAEKKTDWWHAAFVIWSVLSTIGGFLFMYFVCRKG
jgi:hypothetical protein